MTTIGDVANHLGISRSTVSYALSGKRPVSREMKQRIDDAIKELGYWPSAAGQSLATSRRNTIGLLAPLAANTTPSVAMQFVSGVALAARARGLDTLLVTGDEAFNGTERLAKSGVVDGLIALDVEEKDPRVKALKKTPMPAVFIGRPSSAIPFDTIDQDWFSVGEVLLQHLVDLRHHEILVLTAPEIAFDLGMTYALKFRAGYRYVAEKSGVNIIEVPVDNDFTNALNTICDTLTAHPEITAIAVQHESAAVALRAAAASLRKTIPHDLSVVGVTLDVLDATMGPPLSGVSTRSVEMTQQAIDMLIERINQPGVEIPPRAASLTGAFQDRGTSTFAP